MKRFNAIWIMLVALIVLTGNASAKDLGGNIGIGYNSQLSRGGMGSLSAKFWFNDDMGVQGIFGFISSDDYDEMNIGGKFLYKILDEENLHVDVYGGLGLTTYDPDYGDDHTGLTLGGGLSFEFFLSGLPNLGFSTEIGFAFNDQEDTSAFGTTADTFLSAGIHYYFNLLNPAPSEPIN